MPEIEVESEPWLGLVVLADRAHAPDTSGYFGLAHADQWHSDLKKISFWRGPDRPDEKISRSRLMEMNCRTVLVDEAGFYTCPPDLELLEELLEKASEIELTEMANEGAASVWSYVSDDLSDKYNGEVWIIAIFGGAVGTNGDLTLGSRAQRPPRGYEKTEEGGHIGSSEEEIDIYSLAEHLTYGISEELKRTVSKEIILALLRKIYDVQGGYIMWSSSSGRSEVWASRKAIRIWEEGGEERRRQENERKRRAAEEANRRAAEERERQRLEDIERTKRGGYPGPKDWSPSGRKPGSD